MHRKRQTFCLVFVMALGIMSATFSYAGVFGELHAGVGGTYPQGNFTRYANPGLILDLRATIHVPHAEVIVGWVDFNYVMFEQENVESQGEMTVGPVTTYFPVNEKYSEDLFTGHVGIQLGSYTQRGAIRPRAGIGIGFYKFVTDLVWEAELADTTMEVARQELDDQFAFGWRGILGVDFFFVPQFGASVDFIYDHVFDLKRIEGTEALRTTSRFHGFTIGFVYMFKAE
jgi:hypothetical protein